MNDSSAKAMIRQYYQDLWNRWDLSVADRIIAPQVVFRGSLGVAVEGLDGFKSYVRLVQAAFPDFHNRVDELIEEGSRVAARLTYSGTHRGELYGVAPTSRRVEYNGIALFRIEAGRIAEGFVVGDTLSVLRQIGAWPQPG